MSSFFSSHILGAFAGSLVLAGQAFAAATPSASQIFRAENPMPEFSNGYVVYGEAITTQLNAFRGQLTGSVAPYNFEGATVGATSVSLGFTGSAGPINATLSGGVVRNSASFGRYNTTQPSSTNETPRRYLEVQTGATQQAGGPSGQFSISFSRTISAFAFFGTDIGDFDGTLFMDMYAGTQLLTSLSVRDSNTVTPAAGSDLLFYGFASPEVAYDRIVFRTSSTNGNDVFGFDDFWAADAGQLVGTPPSGVPEPGSLALVGLALCAAGCARKARQAT